ncbi:MAG: rhomboid family intramembrane serine protease [Acidimicrobiia bacterium]|nr:rhomboid family intramembrane serine protease [Acidimicrobiia bacterium]
MFPLKDENPTRITPFVTFLIIATCALIYFGPQEGVADELRALDFNLEYAAIPCEIRTGEPLSIEEVEATFERGNSEACVESDGTPSLYPGKNVYLGALTSLFLHGSLLHLLGNMWSLWIFGNNIEDRLGHVRYLLFYLAGGFAATAAHFLAQPSSTVPVVGASGAIAAVMGAYLVWFPNAPIRTIVIFVLRDISAKWFLGIWFVIQFFTGNESGVAWVAHVGGFVFGVLIGLVVRTTDYGSRRINRSDDPLHWDNTGGVGRGPLPHPLDTRRNPQL